MSWLPPGHPKAYISKSAAVLRHELDEAIPIEMEDDGGEQMTLDIQKLLDESLPPPHKVSYKCLLQERMYSCLYVLSAASSFTRTQTAEEIETTRLG